MCHLYPFVPTSAGAGILDAKKALAECDCDMEKAMEWLKKKGMAKADARPDL